MTRKTIAHYLSDLRLDLKDSGALWSDAELTRCVERAVGDLSRLVPDEKSLELTVDAEVDDESFTTPAASDTDYFVTTYDISAVSDGASATLAARRPDVPRPVRIAVTDANTSISQLVVIVKGQDVDNKYVEEFFYLEGGLIQTGKQYFALVTGIEIDEIAGNGAADTMIVGTGSADGVYVQLAYKPIKFQSDSITGQTLETDYEMDYTGGRIAMKSGGGMSAATAYTIDYTRSKLDIDLSSHIDDLISVSGVEYPVGKVPQLFSKVEVWGKTLTLTGGFATQAEVTDEEHIMVKYLAPHSAPGAQSPGSYPSFLDFPVALAASAYALFIYSLKQEHQSVTDLASARTALGNLAASHTLATDALAKIITYLTSNTNEDSKYWLTKITTDIANLRTSVETALDAVATNLGLVFTTSLDKATTGGEALLDTGDDFIDAVNDGARVPENYREFAQTRAEIAGMRLEASGVYVQEAMARLSNLNSYISQAMDGWAGVAKGFAEEANGHLGNMDRYLQEAMAYQQSANDCLTLADRFKAEAIERRNEAWAIYSSPNQIAPGYSLGQRSQPL